jgi:hypothetical protein
MRKSYPVPKNGQIVLKLHVGLLDIIISIAAESFYHMGG